MKTMAGVFLRATLNRSRMRAAATPSNISTNSEPLAEKKATSEDPAMALARYVFPVPGGPSSRIPCPHHRHGGGLKEHAQTCVQCFGANTDISMWPPAVLSLYSGSCSVRLQLHSNV